MHEFTDMHEHRGSRSPELSTRRNQVGGSAGLQGPALSRGGTGTGRGGSGGSTLHAPRVWAALQPGAGGARGAAGGRPRKRSRNAEAGPRIGLSGITQGRRAADWPCAGQELRAAVNSRGRHALGGRGLTDSNLQANSACPTSPLFFFVHRQPLRLGSANGREQRAQGCASRGPNCLAPAGGWGGGSPHPRVRGSGRCRGLPDRRRGKDARGRARSPPPGRPQAAPSVPPAGGCEQAVACFSALSSQQLLNPSEPGGGEIHKKAELGCVGMAPRIHRSRREGGTGIALKHFQAASSVLSWQHQRAGRCTLGREFNDSLGEKGRGRDLSSALVKRRQRDH